MNVKKLLKGRSSVSLGELEMFLVDQMVFPKDYRKLVHFKTMDLIVKISNIHLNNPGSNFDLNSKMDFGVNETIELLKRVGEGHIYMTAQLGPSKVILGAEVVEFSDIATNIEAIDNARKNIWSIDMEDAQKAEAICYREKLKDGDPSLTIEELAFYCYMMYGIDLSYIPKKTTRMYDVNLGRTSLLKGEVK